MFFKYFQRFKSVFRSAPRATVALPAKHFDWMGFDVDEVSMLLSSVGIGEIRFGSDFIINDQMARNCSWSPMLNDALRYAVCVISESVADDVESLYPDVAQEWRLKLTCMLATTKAHFQLYKPDLVVLFQGYEPVNAVARAAAIELEIPFIALENTAHSCRMLWDNVSGITTNKNLARNFYWKYRQSISSDILKSFEQNFRQSLYSCKATEHSAPLKNICLSENKPVVLFLGQVFSDSSIVFGLQGWKSPIDVLISTACWCLDNRYKLIVKLHPKETKGRDTINSNLYDQLTYRKIKEDILLSKLLLDCEALIDSENEYDTYNLIESCEFAVTVNSQSGLEAAVLGKPVVVCGDSFYSGMGFTIDAPTPENFYQQLIHAKKGILPSGASEFAYIFFERYCVPKTISCLIDLIRKHTPIK